MPWRRWSPLFATFATGLALARPVPVPQAQSALAQADNVAMATIVDLRAGPDDTIGATLRIDRVLKSDTGLQPGMVVATVPDEASGREARRGAHVLVALRCQGWTPGCKSLIRESVGWPALPRAAGPAPPAGAEFAALEHGVAAEMLACLGAADSALRAAAALTDADPVSALGERRHHAAEVLQSLPSYVVADALREARPPPDGAGRLWWLGLRMALGDTGALATAGPAMLAGDEAGEMARDFLAGNLAVSRQSPPAVAAVLARWLRSARDERVRAQAASKLGEIAAPDAVAPLLRFGLADPAREVRWRVVQALAAATGEGSGVPLAAFRADEAPTLAYWTSRKADLLAHPRGRPPPPVRHVTSPLADTPAAASSR